mmetsp:Transcript_16670/g.19029  ORF Transcript_16670/g.19029 Transcript_16670/m.19029 type:complete len:89 (+) Transcript_16670:26-292(+)
MSTIHPFRASHFGKNSGVSSITGTPHPSPHHTDCLDVDTFLRHDNVNDFVEAEMPYPKWGDEQRTFENKVKASQGQDQHQGKIYWRTS